MYGGNGLNVNFGSKKSGLSDLKLANIEALAKVELGGVVPCYGMYRIEGFSEEFLWAGTKCNGCCEVLAFEFKDKDECSYSGEYILCEI